MSLEATIVHRILVIMYEQPAENKRNKTVVVAESVLKSVERRILY